MIAFLTSSPGGREWIENEIQITALDERNGFKSRLASYWKAQANGLFVSAAPEEQELNICMRDQLAQSFELSGLSVGRFDICDSCSKELVYKLEEYDFIVLSGGHVPTQNAFFQKIPLKKALKSYDGIVIGISAGTMNSAETVYAQPELEGESTDQRYQRFLNGLSITDTMILPHYQAVKDEILDGKRLMEEITYPDSYGRRFYAIPDGSYLLVENGIQTLFGEAWLISDGEIRQVCREGQSLNL